MDPEELRRHIETLLAAQHVMSLATLGKKGEVHAASLFYVPDGLSLVWTSDPATRHSQHLESQPRVAATIAPDCADFLAVRGLQISGVARRLLDAAEVDPASGMMRERFPFLERLASGPAALREAWARTGFYRLDPERITLIDNSRGFGHKATLQVSANGAVALAESSSHP
ncbi:MAG: pyridoxamine 5'-phosphate oxidase family protein [Ramlibacter sp.]